MDNRYVFHPPKGWFLSEPTPLELLEQLVAPFGSLEQRKLDPETQDRSIKARLSRKNSKRR